MDLASSVLVLLFIVSLSEGAVTHNVTFENRIEGFERECDAPGCRYTGKIVGSITIHGLNYPIPQLCFYIWLYTYVPINGKYYWKPICEITLYPCDECKFPFTGCNCSGYNPLRIQFFPFDGSLYKILIQGSYEESPIKTYPFFFPIHFDELSWSNEFDSSIKPDNWDPIYIHHGPNKQIPLHLRQFSTNGNNQLIAGTNIVGMATLFAFLLTKMTFNE
ncbi:uncharacterized protein LOC131927720 [Physella acuta]|uniref:uncharacterized protein LOC131927720 n=1 Tax=Physella acuta TaxID=109671 RepID=UPI0027DC1D46|nr:uncharacterized protein LOC131927720 [Physella acuta]